ncbi:hypothetical protein [Cyanobium sp. ATX-6F1]
MARLPQDWPRASRRGLLPMGNASCLAVGGTRLQEPMRSVWVRV